MRRLVACLAVLVAALITGAPAGAWGWDGHRIVCDIAWREVQPATRAAIEALQGGGGREAFVAECNWADEVKYRRSHAWSRPWHYISTRDDSGAPPELARDCPPAGCAVSAIVEMVGILRDDPDSGRIGRLEALRFLSHLVADLHQPLHAGRADDLGGNTIDVTFLGAPSTLHRVWDTGLLRAADSDWQALAHRLRCALPARDGLALDPLVWARESHELAHRVVYPLPGRRILDASYVRDKIPVVETRLALAAIRLAALLDHSLAAEPGDQPPFWVGSRRGTVRHYPACVDARAIAPGNLVILEHDHPSRELHRGCPR